MSEQKTLKVLFIDDEELMRDVAELMFEDMGWQVHIASSGPEGLDIYKEHKDSIDIAILDFSMPKMNGIETAEALREIEQDVKIVIISGLVSDDHLEEFRDKGDVGFLAKPFLYEDLVDCIDQTYPDLLK